MTLYTLYVWLLGYSLFRGIRGCIRIISSDNYIENNKSTRKTRNFKSLRFHILIPVLREQEVIEETIKHFAGLKGDYKVYLITTEKELQEKKYSKKIPAKYKNMPTTGDVIRSYLAKHPTYKKNIKLIHSSNISGAVAYQFNYALKKLLRTAKREDYVITYNADSRVETNVLNLYAGVIKENSDCQVIQQSAVFLKNYNELSPFLKSIALLQTRWTLAHEMPRIRKTTTKLGFSEGGHVVAHGLCINYGFFKEIGFFPEDTLNEDLPLGYFIRLHGAKIYLLHNLENAETPYSIKTMFNQYRTWFYAPLYYPENIKKALQNPNLNKFKAIYWGLKYTLRGYLWFALSIAWALLFVLPLMINRPCLIIYSLVSFLIYAPLSFWLIYKTVGKDFGVRFELMPIILSFPVYLTHSVGPWLAVYDHFKSKISGSSIYKNKTER